MFLVVGWSYRLMGLWLLVRCGEETQDPGLEDARVEEEAHRRGLSVLILCLAVLRLLRVRGLAGCWRASVPPGWEDRGFGVPMRDRRRARDR